MAAPLILLDVDKTMIDKNFRLTEPSVIAVIKKLTTGGWQIGLNSDRPAPQLMAFRREWRLNGPLVCEMGNAVYPAAGDTPLFEDELLRQQFDALFHEMLKISRARYSKVTLHIGDVPAMLAQLKRGTTDKPELHILFGGLRKFSFGLNARIKTASCFETEPNLLKELSETAIREFVKIFDCHPRAIVDYHDYGSCILHSPFSSKDKGLAILKNYAVYSPIAIIGDSLADYTGDASVIHCAVANAEVQFKQHCRFVAEQPITAGTKECLEWIERTVPLPQNK